MSEWDKLWEDAEIENGEVFSVNADLTQIKAIGDKLKEKADCWGKTIEILHNYESKAFLDNLDEHRAMRKAFYEIHEVAEAFFESTSQEETNKRRDK